MKRFLLLVFCIVLFSAFSVVGFATRSFPQIVSDCFTYDPNNGGSFIINEEHRSTLSSASAEVQNFYSRLENNPSDFLVSYMSWYGGDFYVLSIADVSNVPSSSVVFSSSDVKFASPVPCLIYNVSSGGSRIPLNLSVTSYINYTLGQVISGSYLDKSIFASVPSGLFDTSMPVARFSLDGVLIDKKTISVNYLDTDGAFVSPPVAISVPVGEEYSIASPSVVGCSPSQTVISGTMPDIDLTFDVVYSPNPYKLTVDFLNSSGRSVAPPVEKTVYYKSEYTVDCPVVSGYTFDTPVVTGIMPPNDFSDTVAYTANPYTLTVNYLDSGGNSVHAPHVSTILFGDNYSVNSPAVEGLEPLLSVVFGTMPPNDHVVNITYSKPMTEYDKILANSLNDLSSAISSNALVLCGIGILLMTSLIIVVLLIRILHRFSNV